MTPLSARTRTVADRWRPFACALVLAACVAATPARGADESARPAWPARGTAAPVRKIAGPARGTAAPARGPAGSVRGAAAPARTAAAPGRGGSVPPLVFAARRTAGAGVPGFGPAGRACVPGGRLLVRGRSGRVREVLPRGRFLDVAHPAVAWDGRWIAFAAFAADDPAWRIWVVGARGESLRAVTRADRALDLAPLGDAAARFARYDDIDPCWLPDGRIVFASTRWPQAASEGGAPTTNLFVVDPAGGAPRRITSERDGAEAPAVDPRDGRVLYARWWRTRYLAADVPGGVTTERARALPADPLDFWQAVSVLPDGDGLRLAAGDPAHRAAEALYAPLPLPDGTRVGVVAANPALVPAPGAASIVAFPRGTGARVVVAGALRRRGTSALAPAALPDGRLVFACDARGDGGYALWIAAANGEHARKLLALPGALALDPAPLVARARPPLAAAALAPAAEALPPATPAEMAGERPSFRFDCMNVFAQGAVDSGLPGAAPLQPGVRIRFYASLARPGAPGGDSLVLLREVPLTAYGAAHVEGIPADVPLVEQLVDSLGRPLRAGSGPAHTASFNFARAGSGTRCVGCHAGHSTLPLPANGGAAAWVNAAPSAAVSASDATPGGAASAAVDRRTRGAGAAWVSAGGANAWLALAWAQPLELRALVLHALPGVRAGRCEVELRRGGAVVGRLAAPGLAPGGTTLACGPTRVDGVVIRPAAGARGAGATGLTEVEAIARLIAPGEAP